MKISIFFSKYFKTGLAIARLEDNLMKLSEANLLSDDEIYRASKFYNDVKYEHDSQMYSRTKQEEAQLYRTLKSVPRPSIFIDIKTNTKYQKKYKDWISTLGL